jgi:hypothetical protein
MATKSYIIALEEHYYDPEVKRHASGLAGCGKSRSVVLPARFVAFCPFVTR